MHKSHQHVPGNSVTETTAFCQVQTGWCVVADVVEVIGHLFVQRLAGPKTIQQLMVSLQAGETGRFGYYSNPHVWAHPRWSFLITLGSGQANNLEAPATEETRSMAAMDDGFASSQHDGPLSAKLSFAGFLVSSMIWPPHARRLAAGIGRLACLSRTRDRPRSLLKASIWKIIKL